MSVVQMNNSSNEQYMFKRTIVQTAVVQMRIHLFIWQPNLINIFSPLWSAVFSFEKLIWLRFELNKWHQNWIFFIIVLRLRIKQVKLGWKINAANYLLNSKWPPDCRSVLPETIFCLFYNDAILDFGKRWFWKKFRYFFNML